MIYRFWRYILKYRATWYFITLAGLLLSAWGALYDLDNPWVFLAVGITFVAHALVVLYARVNMEQQLARHVFTMARQVTHNATGFRGDTPRVEVIQDGVPTNHAWDAAALRIRREGHLHADLNCKWDRKVGTILIEWIG